MAMFKGSVFYITMSDRVYTCINYYVPGFGRYMSMEGLGCIQCVIHTALVIFMLNRDFPFIYKHSHLECQHGCFISIHNVISGDKLIVLPVNYERSFVYMLSWLIPHLW